MRQIFTLSSRIKLAAFLTLSVLGAGSAAGYLLSTTSFAQAQASKKPAEQTPPTPFDDHIKQAGIKACKDVFSTLGTVMSAHSDYRTATFWNQKEADKHATGSLAGLNFNHPSLQGKGVGVVYAAPVGKSCEGISVRVVPVPGTCSDFTASLQNDVAQREDLNGVELLMLKSGAKVMTVPASDNTCLAVTTVFANGKLE